MKYIKEFESKLDYSTIKKYCLLRSEVVDHLVITETLIDGITGNQFKKIYDIENNKLKKMNRGFYFSLPYEKFKNQLIIQSDNLSEILDNVEFYISMNKYNL